MQQGVALNKWHYYVAVFCATVVFYTAAYITDGPVQTGNLRSAWYGKHHRMVRAIQALFSAFVACYAVWFVWMRWPAVFHLSLFTFGLLASFPLAGLLYYGLSGKGIGRYNLRRIGWLKPFTIGFVWAGLVTVFPVVAHNIENGLPYMPNWIAALLFLKNFMYVTVLCIMFDVKDYAADHNLRIKTFVVTYGLRRTIFVILLPLCILGLGSFIAYGLVRHFGFVRIALNVIPFLALISVAYSMHRRHSILYYLIIIDGLMLVKAVCGSIAAGFF